MLIWLLFSLLVGKLIAIESGEEDTIPLALAGPDEVEEFSFEPHVSPDDLHLCLCKPPHCLNSCKADRNGMIRIPVDDGSRLEHTSNTEIQPHISHAVSGPVDPNIGTSGRFSWLNGIPRGSSIRALEEIVIADEKKHKDECCGVPKCQHSVPEGPLPGNVKPNGATHRETSANESQGGTPKKSASFEVLSSPQSDDELAMAGLIPQRFDKYIDKRCAIITSLCIFFPLVIFMLNIPFIVYLVSH